MDGKRKRRMRDYENSHADEYKYTDYYERATQPIPRKKITTSEYDEPWFNNWYEHWFYNNEEDETI